MPRGSPGWVVGFSSVANVFLAAAILRKHGHKPRKSSEITVRLAYGLKIAVRQGMVMYGVLV